MVDIADVLDPSIEWSDDRQVLHSRRLEAVAVVVKDWSTDEMAGVHGMCGKRQVEFAVLVEVGDHDVAGRVDGKGRAVSGRVARCGAPIDIRRHVFALQLAVVVGHDYIEVAVAVDVGGGKRIRRQPGQPLRVGLMVALGAAPEDGHARVAGVGDGVIVSAYNQVQPAVIVQIGGLESIGGGVGQDSLVLITVFAGSAPVNDDLIAIQVSHDDVELAVAV